MLIRAPQKDRYLAGPGLTRLAVNVLVGSSVRAPVRGVLTELAAEFGETCNVGILDQDEVVYIERVEGDSPLRLQLDVGSRVPAHCTAIGKLLVAHQHKNVRTRLLHSINRLAFTDFTLTDPAALEHEFSEIRAQGFSFNHQEYVVGLTALAVLIEDVDGRPLAGLAVHAPATRMSKSRALEYLPRLLDIAQRIAHLWHEDASGRGPDSQQRKVLQAPQTIT